MAGPTDSGLRAWMVVLSRFIHSLLIAGGFKALGVFLPELQKDLQLSASTVGFSLGLSGVIALVLGPVTTALLSVVNYRVVSMIGGVMSGCALILASQAEGASYLTFCMFLLGAGHCLGSIPSVVAFNEYFDKRFALANGISSMGGAIGMVTLSPLAEVFIEKYSWQGAFLVFGALTFNMVVAGALLKPRKPQPDIQRSDESNTKELDKDMSAQHETNLEATLQTISDGSMIIPEGHKEHIGFKHQRKQYADLSTNVTDEESVEILVTRQLTGDEHLALDKPLQTLSDISVRTSESCDKQMSLKHQRLLSADLFTIETDQKSVERRRPLTPDEPLTLDEPLFPCKEENTISSLENDKVENMQQINSGELKIYHEHQIKPGDETALVATIPNSDKNHEQVLESRTTTGYERIPSIETAPKATTAPAKNNNSTAPSSKMQRFWQALVVSFGFHLLHKQKYLLLYLIGFTLYRVSHSSWALFLVSFALNKGLTPIEAALLSSLGGLGTLIGRIAHGPIIDHKILTGAGMWSLLALTCAVTLSLHTVVHSFVGLGVLSVITGAGLGTRYSVAIIVMKENVKDKTSFKSAIGWSFFFQGFGVAIGTPLTGLIYDLTFSYYLAFFAMAGLEAFNCLLFFIVPKIKHRFYDDR